MLDSLKVYTVEVTNKYIHFLEVKKIFYSYLKYPSHILEDKTENNVADGEYGKRWTYKHTVYFFLLLMGKLLFFSISIT